MLKTYIKLLQFARPWGRFAVPYFIFAILHAVFNTMNYAMIIPILNTLFGDDFQFAPVHEMPMTLSMNSESFNLWVSYIYTSLFGVDFKTQNMLILLALVTIFTTILSNSFRYLCSMTIEKLRARNLEKMRNSMFDHIMTMSAGFFSEQRKGDIIAKSTSDVTMVQFCITNTLQVAFREPFLVISYIVAMLAISWKLSIFSILFLPVVAGVIGTLVKKLRNPASNMLELNSDMISTLEESLGGIKVIQSYNGIDYVKSKYHDLTSKSADVSISIARRMQLASPMSEMLGIVAIGVIIIYGGSLVVNKDLDAAQFMAFIAIFSQITRPIRSFIDQFININAGVAAGNRIFKLLNERSPVADKEGAVELDGFKDSIEFRNVCFRYDKSRTILENVSFTVKKGETVALVGPSGGGKTTIGDLVPRYFDIYSGEIFIDGVSTKDCTQDSLRQFIGTVAQDTVLFNDTIAGNLSMGRIGASREEIIEAAKIANAHNFIMETPKGYDTNIGDRGMKLSGGQRQRLSIARAVLKNPDILILDEATSALDTESEKLVQDALTTLLQGRTSIVIAHRLSTIYNADKIIVVDRGHIVEQGTHAELMSKGGIYHNLVEMQSFE